MKKTIAICFCLIAAALQSRSLFVNPSELAIGKSPNHLHLYQGGSTILELHTEPFGFQDHVQLRLENDAIVIDMTGIKDEPKIKKVVIGWNNVKQMNFPALAYKIEMDISSEKDKSWTGIYFEGRTLEGKHYYKLFNQNAFKDKRTIEAVYNLPKKMANFHCRFDFTEPTVFRIYDVRFSPLEVFEKPQDTRKPELLFHASFDDTAKADFAKGNPNPIQSDHLSFESGILGKALRSTRAMDSVLAYKSAGNIHRNTGAISLWVNPQWNPNVDNPYDSKNFHCFVSHNHPPKRHGSGAIWFWSFGDRLRWDTSDLYDSYSLAPEAFMPNRWYHLVMNWDEDGSVAYINGKPAISGLRGDGNSPLKISSDGRKLHLVLKEPELETLFVGCLPNVFGDKSQADALLDDLRIYSAPLSEAEIQQLASSVPTFQATIPHPFVLEGNTAPVRMNITATKAEAMSFEWNLLDSDGKAVVASTVPITKPVGQASFDMDIPIINCKPGDYIVRVIGRMPNNSTQSMELPLHVMRRANPWSTPVDANLELQPVATIVPKPEMPSESFAKMGSVHLASLNGREYLETDDEEGSRFVLRAKLPDANSIYLLEWDYPDDKVRSVDVVAQSAKIKGSEYELQNGYLTGGEYPNTNQFITQKCLYFPRSNDIAVIFMTARRGKPAAIAELRISKVQSGLPAMSYLPPPKEDGAERTIGVYFEDPAINYDFGREGGSPAGFQIMLDRMVAYMKYSGQNVLTYPMVWYHGRIGDEYNPRGHVKGFMEAFLQKFDEDNLGFIPSFNWHNLYFENFKVTQEAIDNGSFHDSPIAIWNTGKPNPGGWHGTPPNYNILHPVVQERIMDEVDYFIAEGAKHPSFKGINFHLTLHCLAWFGNLTCGYNDYTIDAFTAATGIVVPVDRDDPMRGKLYANWLIINTKDQWIDFRCRELANFYKKIAARLAQARPDLRLVLTTFNGMTFIDDNDFRSPDHTINADRAGGLDPKYYTDCPNIVLAQGDYPADFRWRDNHSLPKKLDNYNFLPQYDAQPGFFRLLDTAVQPWLHMHDRYWESAMAAKSGSHFNPSSCRPIRDVPWLGETWWRVSTINPSGYYAMRHYVLPLRYNDLLGITKGGFLIGTYGMEDYLIPFAKAFRALPAKRFNDLPESTETVKARYLTINNHTYLYIVNTSDKPAQAEIQQANITADLVTGRPYHGDTINLPPYTLRSFKLGAPIKPTITIHQ
ncbi:MAG: LamG domain-containing protein [Lentisphaeria bacterium]|nr:LamG domain-containing protein [Lentisphaeria bacterium]